MRRPAGFLYLKKVSGGGRVLVCGHADAVGSSEANLVLNLVLGWRRPHSLPPPLTAAMCQVRTVSPQRDAVDVNDFVTEPIRNCVSVVTFKPASTSRRPWALASATSPFCTTATARPGIFHSSIASVMRRSSAGMKAAMESLRATDWAAIEKSPQRVLIDRN